MVSGSAPANASPQASWNPRSTRSWTNALTSVSQCDGRLGALICCFRPEHASSTATSINSSVAATQRSGNRQATNLPPVCDGLPMEPANRKLYAIHDKIDTNVSAPIARGYRDWVPSTVRTHLAQFSDNLASPALLGDDMLQAKPRRAGDTLMRFIINTTIGVGGIFDPATALG